MKIGTVLKVYERGPVTIYATLLPEGVIAFNKIERKKVRVYASRWIGCNPCEMLPGPHGLRQKGGYWTKPEWFKNYDRITERARRRGAA